MIDEKGFKKIDTKEFELPETLYVRGIENKVFQSIVLEVLRKTEGVQISSGSFVDQLLGTHLLETSRSISIDQDSRNHSVTVKVEVDILYGYPIPSKAEEIQSRLTQEITKLTGLHVAGVHVIFKNMVSQFKSAPSAQDAISPMESIHEEYGEEL